MTMANNSCAPSYVVAFISLHNKSNCNGYQLIKLNLYLQHPKQPNRTMNRLRMRKGRSVVHTNLEDNYGAVVVANHEALAQVLEQVGSEIAIPYFLT